MGLPVAPTPHLHSSVWAVPPFLRASCHSKFKKTKTLIWQSNGISKPTWTLVGFFFVQGFMCRVITMVHRGVFNFLSCSHYLGMAALVFQALASSILSRSAPSSSLGDI